jgi:hypothetical protein
VATKRTATTKASRTPKKQVIPADWKALFIDALREMPVIALACEKASISRSFAYSQRAANESFKAEWEAALEVGLNMLEDAARHRAITISDTLMIFLLKAHNPDKYRDRSTLDLNVDLTKLSDEELIKLKNGGKP